jgi:hypothetical protein
MKWLLTLTFLFGGSASFAQISQGERRDNVEYLSQGRLLNVRIVPGQKSVKIFIAGNKITDLSYNKDHKLLEVTATNPDQQKQVLQFTKDGDAYVISKLPEWDNNYELNLRAETRGQVEEHKIQIKGSKKK